MLFIITGASGTGKSSLVPELKNLLPENYSILDFDELGGPYDGTDVWKDEHLRHMFSIVMQNHEKNIHTVVCGLIRPQWLKKSRKKSAETKISYVLLTVSKEQRRIRLLKRNAPFSLITDEEEIENFSLWMKMHASSYQLIDTTNSSISKVSNEVLKIIHTISSRIPY